MLDKVIYKGRKENKDLMLDYEDFFNLLSEEFGNEFEVHCEISAQDEP